MAEIKIKCQDCKKEITIQIRTIDSLKAKIAQLEKQILILQSVNPFENLFRGGH